MTEVRKVVAGNWKMNLGPVETTSFFRELALPDGEDGPRVAIFPPSLSLAAAVSSRDRDPRVELGVQNIHWEDAGAFTGEVSAAMAREAGATLTLMGHSERRHVFGETDEEVGRKVAAAAGHGLTPVICVGETLDQRRAGRLEGVILGQLDAALEHMPGDGALMVAYEPVWAIGTGETATPRDAADAHALLATRMEALLGERARAIPILYGGSVKPGNAAELLAAPRVDGVLVGGASLDPASFARIVEAATGG